MEKYNQHRYKHLPLGWADFSDNSWCAICSVAYAVSKKFDIEIYPSTLNELLKMHNGFLKSSGVLKWGVLEEIFPDLDIHTHLYNCVHYDPSMVNYMDIVSVDGERYKKGYQSHFVCVVNPVLNEEYDIVDFKIFDPYHGDVVNLTNRYNKGNLKDSIYTIINL